MEFSGENCQLKLENIENFKLYKNFLGLPYVLIDQTSDVQKSSIVVIPTGWKNTDSSLPEILKNDYEKYKESRTRWVQQKHFSDFHLISYESFENQSHDWISVAGFTYTVLDSHQRIEKSYYVQCFQELFQIKLFTFKNQRGERILSEFEQKLKLSHSLPFYVMSSTKRKTTEIPQSCEFQKKIYPGKEFTFPSKILPNLSKNTSLLSLSNQNLLFPLFLPKVFASEGTPTEDLFSNTLFETPWSDREFHQEIQHFRSLLKQIDELAQKIEEESCLQIFDTEISNSDSPSETNERDKQSLCQNTAESLLAKEKDLISSETKILNHLSHSHPNPPPIPIQNGFQSLLTEQPPLSPKEWILFVSDLVDESEIISSSCFPEGREHPSCFADVLCVVQATLFSFLPRMVQEEMLAPSEISDSENCTRNEQSCLTNIMHSFISVLYSTISNLWSLLRQGLDWSVRELPSLWEISEETENEISEHQELLSHLNEQDLEAIEQNESSWITEILYSILHLIEEWIRVEIFCEKWAGPPNFSLCLQPMRSWDCLDCGMRLRGLCQIGGFTTGIITEFIIGGKLFTALARGAQVSVQALRQSTQYQEVLRRSQNTHVHQRIRNFMEKRRQRSNEMSTGGILQSVSLASGKIFNYLKKANRLFSRARKILKKISSKIFRSGLRPNLRMTNAGRIAGAGRVGAAGRIAGAGRIGAGTGTSGSGAASDITNTQDQNVSSDSRNSSIHTFPPGQEEEEEDSSYSWLPAFIAYPLSSLIDFIWNVLKRVQDMFH